MKFLLRVDFWFLLTGVLYFILCILLQQSTFNINAHDTYFVFDFLTLGITALIYHSFFSVVYFFIRNYSMTLLGLIHLILGLPFFLGIIFFPEHVLPMTGVPRRYYENSVEEPLVTTSVLITSLLILGQLLFLFNLVFSIMKMRRIKR
jgi:cytochrome c oxidase subunit I